MFTYCTQCLCGYSRFRSTWGQEICQSINGKTRWFEKATEIFYCNLKRIALPPVPRPSPVPQTLFHCGSLLEFVTELISTHLELLRSFWPPRLFSSPSLVKIPTRTMMATTPQMMYTIMWVRSRSCSGCTSVLAATGFPVLAQIGES